MIPFKPLKKHKTLLITLALTLLLAIGLTACGKKGAPQPPLDKALAVARPVNLAYTLADNHAVITWDIAKEATMPEGFEVSLATKDATGCEGCPFIFKAVGTVPMPDQRFQSPLKEGLHHYFRIQSLGPDGSKSKYSDTLYVEAK